jgi:hypothetical protein
MNTQRLFIRTAASALLALALAAPLEAVSAPSDEEIANGLDPITLGQAIGNFAGGTVLTGEYLPGASPVLTAERR